MVFCRYPKGYNLPSYNSKDLTASINEQNLSPSNCKLSYPLLNNLQNKLVQDSLNDYIVLLEGSLFTKHVLLKEVIDFKEVVSAYKIHLNEKGLISILLNLYVYENKAAHGMTYFSSFTANLETGEIYNLSDFFNSKINYTKFLSDIAVKKAKEMNVPIIEEYKGVVKNQQFYLTHDSLVLYYKIYEFTPYYIGNFEIKIPYVEIKNLLDTRSPIQKLL